MLESGTKRVKLPERLETNKPTKNTEVEPIKFALKVKGSTNKYAEYIENFFM